jgi:hypothetical protein
MGLTDKVTKGAQAARAKREESRVTARDAEPAREAEAAQRVCDRLERLNQRFEEVRRACPFPIGADQVTLPGGVTLFDDEFLVTV